MDRAGEGTEIMKETVLLLLQLMRGKAAAAAEFAIRLLRRLHAQNPNAPPFSAASPSEELPKHLSVRALGSIKALIVFLLGLMCRKTGAAVQFTHALLRRLHSRTTTAPSRVRDNHLTAPPTTLSSDIVVTAAAETSSQHRRTVKEILVFFWKLYVSNTLALVQFVITLLRRISNRMRHASRSQEEDSTAFSALFAQELTTEPEQISLSPSTCSEIAPTNAPVSGQTPIYDTTCPPASIFNDSIRSSPMQFNATEALEVPFSSPLRHPNSLPFSRSEILSERTLVSEEVTNRDKRSPCSDDYSSPNLHSTVSLCGSNNEVSIERPRFALRPTAPSFKPGRVGSLDLPNLPHLSILPTLQTSPTSPKQSPSPISPASPASASISSNGNEDMVAAQDTETKKKLKKKQQYRGKTTTRGGRGSGISRGGRGGASGRGSRGGATRRGSRSAASKRGGRGGKV